MTSVRLFSCDLDGTLVGNAESPQRFRAGWSAIPPPRRPLLCYNTGRLVEDVLALVVREGLPEPEYVLGGIGTQVWDTHHGAGIPGFAERFALGWDLSAIETIIARDFPQVERQPPEFLHSYKSSWYLPNAEASVVSAIERRLRAAGLDIIVIYSGLRYLDVLPRHASKGPALIWLAQHLGVPPAAVLVAGDSGNDSSMFCVPGVRGIVVENVQPELLEACLGREVHLAAGIMADGVLDGLRHFGVIDSVPRVPIRNL